MIGIAAGLLWAWVRRTAGAVRRHPATAAIAAAIAAAVYFLLRWKRADHQRAAGVDRLRRKAHGVAGGEDRG